MCPLPVRRTRAFIVRIWSEYLDQTPSLLRGEIEDTETQDVSCFISLEEMSTIIHALGLTASRSRHPPETKTDTSNRCKSITLTQERTHR